MNKQEAKNILRYISIVATAAERFPAESEYTERYFGSGYFNAGDIPVVENHFREGVNAGVNGRVPYTGVTVLCRPTGTTTGKHNRSVFETPDGTRFSIKRRKGTPYNFASASLYRVSPEDEIPHKTCREVRTGWMLCGCAECIKLRAEAKAIIKE